MTTPTPRTMTKNEMFERLAAVNERCRTCTSHVLESNDGVSCMENMNGGNGIRDPHLSGSYSVGYVASRANSATNFVAGSLTALAAQAPPCRKYQRDES